MTRLLTASSWCGQGRVSQQSTLPGRRGAHVTAAAEELFAGAPLRLFALPSSYCQGVLVPPRSSHCPSSSCSGNGNTRPAPVAEETQHPPG